MSTFVRTCLMLVFVCISGWNAAAQVSRSQCLTVAQNSFPQPIPASFTTIAAEKYSVAIDYIGHSTFLLQDEVGTKIATDFNGYAGKDVLPDVVTMNHAHSTHFTHTPDPRIPHVLRGWNPSGGKAEHFLEVGEFIVRNVPTDIYRSGILVEENGNSIFIFEVAGLCIGHLGHLHHLLTDEHFAQIGRLDVLMVPIDGGYTLDIENMVAIARRLDSSVILPMHWFSDFSLSRFIGQMEDRYPVKFQRGTLSLNLNNLPDVPTVVVMRPQSPSLGRIQLP